MAHVARWAGREGEVALWNPYMGGGMPFLADPNNLALHPLALLWHVLPPARGVTLFLALHRLVLPLSTFLLARVCGGTRGAALLSATILGFGGFAASLGNFCITLATVAWSPLAIAGTLRALARPTAPRVLVAAIPWTLCYLGGEPFTMVMNVVLSLVLGAALRPAGLGMGRHAARLAGVLCATGATALLLSAVVVLPNVELLRHSSRGEGYDFDEYAFWSLPRVGLLELVVPNVTGDPHGHRNGSFWASGHYDNQFPYFLSLYPGAGAWVLCLASGGARGSRLRLPLQATAIAGIALALGRFLPGGAIVHALCPVLWSLRFPVKWYYLTAVASALLAGFSWDALRERSPAGRAPLVAAAALGATLVTLGSLRPAPVEALWSHLFASHRGAIPAEEIGQRIGGRAAEAGAFWIASALVALGVARGALSRRRGAAVLVGIAVLDLHLATAGLNPTTDATFYDAPAAAMDAVRRHAGPSPRVYDATTPRSNPGTIHAPEDRKVWQTYWQASMLKVYAGVPHGVRYALDLDFAGLNPTWMRDLRHHVLTLPPHLQAGAMAALGIELVVSLDGEQVPGTVTLAKVPTNADVPLAVARVPGAAPWAGMEGGPAAEILGFAPNHAELRVRAPSAGRLVIRETRFPGWRATVDGAPTDVVPFGQAFMAVPVPAGEHLVTLRFDPASYRWGRGISAISWIGIAAFLVRSRARRAARP